MTTIGSSLARSAGEGDRDVSAEARSAKAEAVEGAAAHEQLELVRDEPLCLVTFSRHRANRGIATVELPERPRRHHAHEQEA
jgi:hypothetical protein